MHALRFLGPEIFLTAVACALYFITAFWSNRRAFAWTSLVALVAASIWLIVGRRFYIQLPTDVPTAASLVVAYDPLAWFGRLMFALSGIVLLGMAWSEVDDRRAGEFFGSLLLAVVGMMITAGANELILLFLGLELISIPTYVLLYLTRHDVPAQEAATKYFFLSIFSAALLLYGLALLYGVTGVTNLVAIGDRIDQFMPHLDGTRPLLPPVLALVSLVLVLAGLSFKVTAVPFHWYAPDVYQGTPTIVASLLAWVPKGAGFFAIIRVVSYAMEGIGIEATTVVWVLAVVTMTWGNILALLQDNLKRLLAYSSVVHAGYLLIGVTVGLLGSGPWTLNGVGSVVFYLATYAAMTLGAFAVLIALDTPERPVETIDDLNGLSRTHRFEAITMAIFLFSLAGVPPLAGFLGKYYVFASALAAGPPAAPTRSFQVLAVIGAVNAAVSAYYYLRIVMAMMFRDPIRPPAHRRRPAVGWAIWACVLATLILGIVPRPFIRAAAAASRPGEPLPQQALVSPPAAPQ